MTRRNAGLLTALLLLAGGCGVAPYLGSGGSSSSANTAAMKAAQMDSDKLMAKTRLMQEVMNEPDLPAWHSQREKLTLALGDRVFDKDFNRVFDSLTVALASMEARVNNMERQSGYITANAPVLPPEREKALSREAMVDYCRQKGYDPAVLEKQGQYDTIDVEAMSGMMNRWARGMTISLVRQTPTQVKIRFDHLYYPRLVEEHCCPN